MRPVDEQVALISQFSAPLPPLELTLRDARGCVVAEDVRAPWPLPSFNNSSMDGYAVRSADVATASPGNPVRLNVIDDVPAGFRSSRALGPGMAIRIMTGALLPDGADAVVPVEQTDGGMPTVTMFGSAQQGDCLRLVGEDVQAGEIVISRGTQLQPQHLAVAAAVGRARLYVHPRPRVVILSTGSELVEPGTQMQPGLVVDSNGITLSAMTTEVGALPFRVGPIPDDPAVVYATLEDQLVRSDIIVTTGGVSQGAYDTVKAVLSRLGTVEFLSVAMRPGKPQGFGLLGPDRVPIFTLPGNPVSAFVSFEVFVRPMIRRMLGHSSVQRPMVEATFALPAGGQAEHRSPLGLREYVRGFISRSAEGGYAFRPTGPQSSHILSGLASANALAVAEADVTSLRSGDRVRVMLLDRDVVDRDFADQTVGG